MAAGQVFYLLLISGLAGVAQDLDAEFPKEAEKGLPMGVEETLACPQYAMWDRDSDSDCSEDFDLMESRNNYASANEYSKELLQQYMEDLSDDMVAGPFTSDEQPADFLGIPVQEIHHGAQGIKLEDGWNKKQEKGFFDGTSNGTNPRIRKRLRYKSECPSAADLRHALKLENAPMFVRLEN